MTRPAWPTLLANDNSRFYFLKNTKPAHEHHLQVLPALTSLVPARLPGLFYEHENLTASRKFNIFTRRFNII
jgi:hypothetical protein